MGGDYIEAGHYMTPIMVSERLGVSAQRTSVLLAEGQLPHVTIGHVKLIPAAAVEELFQRRRRDAQVRLDRMLALEQGGLA